MQLCVHVLLVLACAKQMSYEPPIRAGCCLGDGPRLVRVFSLNKLQLVP